MEYKKDELRSYIENSELIIINDDFRIRLSKELLVDYHEGIFNHELSILSGYINQIKSLGIKYPANAKPIFYTYIVPTNNFRELLNFPAHRNYNGGGKPVSSYDLEGFNLAYGVSDNKLNRKMEPSIMQRVNRIHEFAHLVCSMFLHDNIRIISEGFAEALPLYTLDYESEFDEHREMLGIITEDQILSAEELICLAHNSNFNAGAIAPSKSCAFDFSYISSYLFVRGCLESIESKFNLDRIQATQKFLEILKQSQNSKQFLIFDIANAIGLDPNELLDGKKLQLEVIKRIKEKSNAQSSFKPL